MQVIQEYYEYGVIYGTKCVCYYIGKSGFYTVGTSQFSRRLQQDGSPTMRGGIRKRVSYGSREHLEGIDSGVRKVAPSFGKPLFLTYSQKCGGAVAVESNAERFIAHILTLDPGVLSFQTQPFTVDLIDRRIYRTASSVAEARARHKGRDGQKFYTPDFGLIWHSSGRAAIEVKLEGYEGDSKYLQRMALGRDVIEASGMEFIHIVWPRDPRNPLKANVPLLIKAMRRVDLWPSAELVAAVESTLDSRPTTVRQLCSALSLTPDLIPTLLVSGVLAANVSEQPINGEMRVTPGYGDLGSLALLRRLVK